MNPRVTLDLSAPWHIARAKLAEIFRYDREVDVGAVETAEEGLSVTLTVSNRVKADALRKVLPLSLDFGNVKLAVVIKCSAEEETPADIFRAAFAYNPLVRDIVEEADPAGVIWTYLVMEPDPVQFPADNLSDYRRNVSMLVADAARDVLSLEAGTAVCTADLNEN